MKLSVYALDIVGLGASSAGMALSNTEGVFLIATFCFLGVLLLIMNGDWVAHMQAWIDSHRSQHRH